MQHAQNGEARYIPSSQNTLLAPKVRAKLKRAEKLEDDGKLKESLDLYLKLADIHPEIIEIQGALGRIYYRASNFEQAYEHYKNAVSMAPGIGLLWHSLGTCLMQMSQYQAAFLALDKALSLEPSNDDIYTKRGCCLCSLKRFEEGLVEFDQAITLNANNDRAYLDKGNAYEIMGDNEHAANCYEQALSVNSRQVKALLRLSEINRLDRDGVDVNTSGKTRIEKLLTDSELTSDQQREVYFAAAQQEVRLEHYDQAFDYYAKANRQIKETYPFDRREFNRFVDQLIAAFTPEVFKSFSEAGVQSMRPIFILGMPRSGTTLVEQIISSHPKVIDGGELDRVPRLVRGLLRASDEQASYPHHIAVFSHSGLKALGEDYLNFTEQLIESGVECITDKMPFNFLHLGLIKLILPGAKIIHCVRDPMDTCLSCFFQNFADASQLSFTSDLEDLGFYYTEYQRLMKHWHRVIGDEIFDICYEDLIENQEPVSRSLLDHLELEWDDACLNFFENKRAVRTASIWQVRQPIYRSSRERWRLYEKHLGPLQKALQGNA